MGRPSRFSSEVRERAIRLVMEPRPAHPLEWAALQAVVWTRVQHTRNDPDGGAPFVTSMASREHPCHGLPDDD